MKLLSRTELLAHKKPLENELGVYFLWDENEIVYIGQTSYSVEGRLAAHKADKKFDGYTFIPIIESIDLDLLEAEYIFQFSPRYNRALPTNPRYKTRAIIQTELEINGWDFRRITAKNDITPNSMGYYDIREFSQEVTNGI